MLHPRVSVSFPVSLEREKREARAAVTWQSWAWIQAFGLTQPEREGSREGGGSLCFTLASGIWEGTVSFKEMKMDSVLPW